ncbi:DUF317 domain-containing protein [Streptomyces paludis]|uniref:DUF317 domain-containing protein n=1 Tax=Streptomyces paludis TaxID=2282738 RepID=A0A345HVM9_9ACTN|nr:DUF317 domain-containing protein [Streptomyces paludis]AXG80753.1 DUF317 domain-containing protein [Streptomyces paludis]
MIHPFISTRAAEPHHTIWFETSPRHLAGRGDPRRITETLRAAGWKNHSDQNYPQVVLASPDYRHTVVLEPEPEPYKAWWRIRSDDEQRRWSTEFGAHTPVEILAALTDALLAPVPETTPEIWPPLTAAGWTYERDARGNESATHPDGIMSLRRRSIEPGEHFYWTAEARHDYGATRALIWHAYLDDRMPTHLIAAFTTALASPEPVQRALYDVPHAHLVTQMQRGPQGKELADTHEARLKGAHAAARKARRSATPGTRSAPAPATDPPRTAARSR